MRRLTLSGFVTPLLMLLLFGTGTLFADWAKGVDAYKKRDYKTAVSEFQAVAKQSPDHAGTQYMLGLSLRGARQLPQALTALQKAVKLDPQNASYGIALGQTLVQAGKFNDAYLVLKKIPYSKLDSRSKSMYAPAFGTAAIKAGFPAEAVKVLELQSRSSSDSSLFYSLGYAYGANGNWSKAFQAFKKAYELNPKDPKNGRSAVKAAISGGRRSVGSQKKSLYSQGARVAEKLANGTGSFDDALLAGEAWLGAEEYTKALAWFDKAQVKQSQNSLVRFYKAQCLTSLGRNSEAIASLKDALKIGVSGKLRTQVYGQMGYVYDKMKRYDDAAGAYQNAGNSSKVREMRDKKEKAEANAEADKQQREYQAKLKALEKQIEELRAIGETEEANQLQEHLDQLKKQ